VFLTLTLLATAAAGFLAGHAIVLPMLWRARRALRAAHHDATHDDVTGLPNRRALLAHLAAARRDGEAVAVAMIDLDHFKTVNDTLGHDAGDQLLGEVADRLTERPAPVRFVARLQGDEFVLVIDDDGDTDATFTAAVDAWRAIAGTPAHLGAAFVSLSASVGVATPRLGVTARQLLHDADLAMYEAKRAGVGVVRHLPGPDDIPVRHRPSPRHRDRGDHGDGTQRQ